jgi:futalosine hydrolase
MSFKILYVTATALEAEALSKILLSRPEPEALRSLEISILVTGVGSIATAWSLKQWLVTNRKPDLIINAGIAGSYKEELGLGDVVVVVSDCFADAGIEDGENHITLFEAGFTGDNEFPYKNGILQAEQYYSGMVKKKLKTANAITVNTSTGSEATRDRLVKKFNPDIETMEGATFFYICIRENIPFLALRAISNRVEKRDRGSWNISLALNNLSFKLIDIFLILQRQI